MVAGVARAPVAQAQTLEGAASPESPADLAAAGSNRSLRVQWGESAAVDAVTEYVISAEPEDATSRTSSTITTDGQQRGVTIPELVNGVRYRVSVSARNAVGASAPAQAWATPYTVPAAPGLPSAAGRDAAALVRWSPPEQDGGSPVQAYVVRAHPSGVEVRVPATALSARVVPLVNGAASRFTVVAVNAAGNGAASQSSSAATPRKPAQIVITRQPVGRIVFGAASTVRASVRTLAGVGLANQQVFLLAKIRPSTSWRRVASATTGSTGAASLRAQLPASAALRLRHPAGAVTADDVAVRSVVVAKRVTVAAGRTTTRQGMFVTVRGRVAPLQRIGSPVHLQRLVNGTWVRIASGRMTTRSAYTLRWSPNRVGSYVLRVVKSGDAARRAGVSARWRARVNPETAADIAADIFRDRGITLATVHVGGVADRATARQNIVDVANGRLARRSCHGSAPCGSTPLDRRMLRAVRQMGARVSLTVSEFAGGVHAGRSAHYSGRGIDITWVDGRHVAPGSSYRAVVNICYASGASEVYAPSTDPYGGHSNHVHCAWS